MRKVNLRARYWNLMLFFSGIASQLILWDIVFPSIGLRALARRTRSSRFRRMAADFRVLAVRMGGIMIKLGQFLSARLDVMPAEITDELAGLQDEVPAEDFSVLEPLVVRELGGPLDVVFEWFDEVPLAAASLGQVHRARLNRPAGERDGLRDVVVKIQRPRIRELIDVDFAALRRFGGWLQHYKPIRKRVDVLALIQELSEIVHREIDYLAEAKSADTFRTNFAGRKEVRVPQVIWTHTTEHVLALEDVYAIKITDYDAIEAAGISRATVAEVLFNTYLVQIFEDRFFHADPHPGNLFVSPQPRTPHQEKTPWQLTFVDFGMVGTVPVELLQGLRQAIIGIGTRNAAKVVQAYETLGVLLPGTDLRVLEEAEARLFDRFWGMSLRELRSISHDEMRRFAHQFRDVMLSLPFQVPHNLLLLGRAIAILSGMCAGLDPDFNLWAQLSPYAQKLVAGEESSKLPGWLDELGEVLRVLITLPGRAGGVLAKVESGQLIVRMPEIESEVRRLNSAVNRIFGGMLFATLLFAGTLLYQDDRAGPAYAMWALAVIALLWSMLNDRGRSS